MYNIVRSRKFSILVQETTAKERRKSRILAYAKQRLQGIITLSNGGEYRAGNNGQSSLWRRDCSEYSEKSLLHCDDWPLFPAL